jgi:hypothetical protein
MYTDEYSLGGEWTMTEERKSILSGITLPSGSSVIGPERLQDIAIEAERLCGAVRRSASAVTFNDEPSQFRILLDRRAR